MGIGFLSRALVGFNGPGPWVGPMIRPNGALDILEGFTFRLGLLSIRGKGRLNSYPLMAVGHFLSHYV